MKFSSFFHLLRQQYSLIIPYKRLRLDIFQFCISPLLTPFSVRLFVFAILLLPSLSSSSWWLCRVHYYVVLHSLQYLFLLRFALFSVLLAKLYASYLQLTNDDDQKKKDIFRIFFSFHLVIPTCVWILFANDSFIFTNIGRFVTLTAILSNPSFAIFKCNFFVVG